ncbi:hypothetical protein BKA62DRAFT_699254 [Auriculariales sp. MPI-PUGE-AT-0066]|nr:hypothetical protein BKA62DRAFT_699254 [Auriculariales sp. MPI-PUGE-AT-0066]
MQTFSGRRTNHSIQQAFPCGNVPEGGNLIRIQTSEATLSDSARASFDDLPIELVVCVFGHVPMSDRLAIALVCKNWKQAMFKSPELWRVISYTSGDFQSPNALGQLLQLSESSPLDLDVNISGDDCTMVCDNVRRALHRCVRLRMHLKSSFIAEDGEIDITRTLTSVPAPMLRTFILVDIDGNFNPERSSDIQLFSSVAPMLREIKMQGDIEDFLSSSEVIRPVRFVRYRHLWNFSWDTIPLLFRVLPNVEELTFQVKYWEVEDFISSPWSELYPPTSLRTLKVLADDDAAHARSIVQRLHRVPLQALVARYGRRATSKNDGMILNELCAVPIPLASARVAFVARTFLFEFSTKTHGKPMNIQLFDEDVELHRPVDPGTIVGRLAEPTQMNSRVMLEVGRSANLDSSLFIHVVRLYLTETSVTWVGSQLPPLPALQHMTVYTTKQRSYASHIIVSAFDSYPPMSKETIFPITCPLLQTLRIGVRALDDEPAINIRFTPEMVGVFMSTYLLYGYSTRKLVRLEFFGVELVVLDAMGLKNLLDLADTVEWDQRHLASKFDTSFHPTWV